MSLCLSLCLSVRHSHVGIVSKQTNTLSNVLATWFVIIQSGGTAAAAPPPSGLATLPSVGAVPQSPHISVDQGTCCVLCLLCHYCIFSVNCVIYVCLQYFDTVGWVFRPVKNRRPYNLYCVGGDVKPCSINQSLVSKRPCPTYRI